MWMWRAIAWLSKLYQSENLSDIVGKFGYSELGAGQAGAEEAVEGEEDDAD